MDWPFDSFSNLDYRSLGAARVFATPRGRGPVLLLVHGGFHGAWCWSGYLAFFARLNIPAAAIDLPGHGGLPPPDGFSAIGLDAMSDHVVRAAAALGGDVVLAGHSLGALVAMTAARTIASRALVMLAPALPGNIPTRHPLRSFPPGRPVAPPSEDRARKWFLQGLPVSTEIGPYLERLSPESPAFLNGGYGGSAIVDAGWVAGPSLCISGANDVSPFHPAGSDAAVAAFYNADSIALAGAGHCFMVEAAGRQSAALLRDWIVARDLAGSF